MKVEFARNKEQKVWFSEWNIYLDGTYSGFIYKTSRKDSWNIACSRFGLGAVNPIACQKTFSDAKNIVRKFVDEWNEMQMKFGIHMQFNSQEYTWENKPKEDIVNE